MAGALIYDRHLLFAEALAGALRQRGVETTVIVGVEDAFPIPDIAQIAYVVVGVDGVGASSEEDIRRIRECFPDAWLVCVGADDHRGHGSPCLVAGADLLLSKDQPLRVLLDAVLAVPAPVWPRGRASLAQSLPGLRGQLDRGPLAAHFLTKRERDVLRLLVRGASTRQISDSLGIASVTARCYVQDTMTKLGVHSRLEAVRYAMLNSVV